MHHNATHCSTYMDLFHSTKPRNGRNVSKSQQLCLNIIYLTNDSEICICICTSKWIEEKVSSLCDLLLQCKSSDLDTMKMTRLHLILFKNFFAEITLTWSGIRLVTLRCAQLRSNTCRLQLTQY